MEPAKIDDANHDRRRFIGGSDAAAVMGMSPYRTPYEVFVAKTSDIREEMDPEKKKFLERRKRWEPVVVQMLREEFDAEIVSINQRYVDPEVPYFAAEIDFEWRDTDGSIQNGEIKTVHPRAFSERQGWGEAGTGDVPIEYEAQTMHGLGIMRRRTCVLAAMVGLDDMLLYRIDRNEAVIAEMRARLMRFWTEHVATGIAPDPQTIRDLTKMFPTTNGLSVEGTTEIGSKALQLRALSAQMKALELAAEALEFDVKNHMREHEYLMVDGRKVFSWKEQNWSMLDQSGLKARYPRIHKEMMLSGRRRTFLPLAGS